MGVSVTTGFDQGSAQRLAAQLELLRFNPRRRFELARAAANEVKKFSAARARGQESLAGGKMPPRSTKRSRYRKSKDGNWRKKRRMFEALGKAGNMATYRDGESVVVSWKKTGATGGWANIAFGHFHGMETTITRSDKNAVNKQQDSPATKRMADALLRHGYRQPVRAKNGRIKLRRVSSMHIRKVMNQKQAAWLLRLLVHGDVNKPKKSSWTIRTPPRPFLGVSQEQGAALLAQVARIVIAEINAK